MSVSATNTAEKPDFVKERNKQKSVDSQMQQEYIKVRSRDRAQQFDAAKVKQTELILFTTQLAVMLDSGVVLSDALDAIAEQSEEGTLKMIIMDVAEAVKGGENFSKALSVYPKAFSSMFISMVRASEASGKMVEMLEVLSSYLNFEFETRKRIKGA